MHARSKKWIAPIDLAICCATMCAAAASILPKTHEQTTQGAASLFREEMIAQVSPGSDLKETFWDLKHVAWVEHQSGKKTVRLDGKEQATTT